MSYAGLLDRTATITHRSQTGSEGRYNVPTWETSTTEGVPYMRQQRGRSEDLDQRQDQFADWELFFLLDVDIDGSDLITDEADGQVLEVVGPPYYLDFAAASPDIRHVQVYARSIDNEVSS